jgi:hypothetical protein
MTGEAMKNSFFWFYFCKNLFPCIFYEMYITFSRVTQNTFQNLLGYYQAQITGIF